MVPYLDSYPVAEDDFAVEIDRRQTYQAYLPGRCEVGNLRKWPLCCLIRYVTGRPTEARVTEHPGDFAPNCAPQCHPKSLH